MIRFGKLHLRNVALAALACGLGLGALPNPGRAADWPAVTGAVFAVRDMNVATDKIKFDTKGRDLMAFDFMTRGRSLYGRYYDLICAGGSFHAKDAGGWIGMQVAKSGAFSVEMTVTTATAQPKAPGDLLCFGDDKAEDFALLQDSAGLAMKLGGGKPIPLFAVEAGKPVHLLVACDKDGWAAYKNGQPAGAGKFAAPPAAWAQRELVFGATFAGTDAWYGRLDGLAIFPKALTANEAAAEAAAIKEIMAARKPATAIRFKGTLVRQAKTASIEEIRPYTRSMSVAEYKVTEVLSGEWKQPTIYVLHWMILDGKRLPIADRQPGLNVELTVERSEDHPQLESCRRDEIEGEVVTDLFYCENE